MDEQVLQAMRRWPDVPDCVGWLGLDARGQWWVRDVQARPWPRTADGHLDKHGASRVLHEGLLEFIGRNYAALPDGRWYFQNGPQRVFVELEAAPLVLRLQPDGSWRTHTGLRCQPLHGVVDAAGRLFLATSAGPGLVHSLDIALLADGLDGDLRVLRLPAGEALALEPAGADEVARKFGFEPAPSAWPEA